MSEKHEAPDLIYVTTFLVAIKNRFKLKSLTSHLQAIRLIILNEKAILD